MKVYITKYALTSGVFVFECEMKKDGSYVYGTRSKRHMLELFHGNDFHTTKESALKRCEEMRAKKIKSLKKQTQKILDIKFEITEEI